MITGKTDTGFEFSIDENNLNNMEFLDALCDSQDDGLSFSKVVKMMLGDEQRKALYEHVRTEDGRVPIDAIEREIEQMMNAGAELKNSQS